MIIGIAGVWRELLRDSKFQCACLGTKINIPLTHLTLIEDIIMAIMSIMIIWWALINVWVVQAQQEWLSRDIVSMDEKMNIHMCLMWWGEKCEQIFAPENRSVYSDAIQEQCDIMAWMEKCNEYFGTQTSTITTDFSLLPQASAPEATAPQIVELQDGDRYTITIQDVKKTINGKAVRMLAYNWSVPGPILKAPQWSTITLTLVNDVDDIETTMHHHGLRHENRYDGVPVDMWWFDVPINKGESIEYKLTFPDAGIFWYHPHVREDLQQELWLYGNYLITDQQQPPVNNEQTLMLDDILLNDDGAIVPFDSEQWTHVVMGRFGNMPIVNGDTNFTLNLQQGEVTRLYITNVANVTPFNLTIPGIRMKLVWGDIGTYEHQEFIDSLIIAPAERYIIDIYTEQPGTYTITNKIPDNKTYTLWTITVGNESISPSYANQFEELSPDTHTISDIDRYRQYFNKPIDKTLLLDVEMDGMIWADEHSDTKNGNNIERYDTMPTMNEASTTENTRRFLVDQETGKKNMDINRTFNQWDVVKIRIINDPTSVHPMQHPVHFHGQRFLVINQNGQPTDNFVRKDTVLVPTGEYVDILLDASNLGKRMAHCHIAEHLTAWMMMNFEVIE